MKLLDLLVKELPKRGGWPCGANKLHQDYDGDLWVWYGEEALLLCKLEVIAENNRAIATNAKHEQFVTREQYESALSASEGWIEWGGGECPVEEGTLVDVGFRDGDDGMNIEAIDLLWNHENWGADIIAYRLHNPDINSRASDERQEPYLNECIGQDIDMPEWNGEGLPPVGTICQAKVKRSIAGWEWRRVKVVESGIHGAEKEALVYDLETTIPAWADEFRPLRTEAEKARDDAKKAISELRDRDGYKLAACMIDPIYEAIAEGKIPGVKLENN